MDMKAKSSLIRKYRTERLWSQEQLAEISGLGLRTIQRLEARGSGSQESIKALAAVFNVDADTLLWRYRQRASAFCLVCSRWLRLPLAQWQSR